MDNQESQGLTLKLLVGKEKNEVVFAESNHEFVDVLFSFMTIPIGGLIKLIDDQLFGCISNLYASVENFDEKLLPSKICRDVLLHPRSAAEINCRNLRANLYETDGNKYYKCDSCTLVSFYSQNGNCSCGESFLYELTFPSPNPTLPGGFTKSTTRLMISNDLNVRTVSTMTGVTLLNLLGGGDMNMFEERTINVEKDKVLLYMHFLFSQILELLKFSLVSKTPLTKAFLDSVPFNRSSCSFSSFDNGPRNIDQCQEMINSSDLRPRLISKKGDTISLKLIIDSINNTVLYAEAANDFVTLLCSFLTFPVSYLFQKNTHLHFSGCIDNLYKSINSIEVKLFQSWKMKETLTKSKLPPGLAQLKKVISIEDACITDLKIYKASLGPFNSKSHNGDTIIAKGFIKGPSSFTVMDNLSVLPLSSISGLCLIKEMQIPLSKIVEKEVVIAESEAIRLFTASLVAKNALTDTFLRDDMKQEQ